MQANNLNIDEQSLITPALVDKHGKKSAVVGSEELREAAGNLAIVLELARQRFERSEPAGIIVDRLAADLHRIRNTVSPEIWHALIPMAQKHQISEYLQQDPFTRWSFEKPRGYTGDASLIDILYKHDSAADYIDAATPLGREIYAYTVDAPSSVATRERREILAETVDKVAFRNDGAEVFAVACGHLREAELSKALAAGKVSRWVALDQDPESVETVKKAGYGDAVEPVIGNVAGLMRRSYKLGSFDLVYASGLYDYLPRAVAVRLTQRLMELVKPGGTFLFANFSDEIVTDGYMETFMDWPLILRNDEHMWDIVNASIDRNTVESKVFYGVNRNIIYATISKK